MNESDTIARLQRRIDRERSARKQAESLLESKSRELFIANEDLLAESSRMRAVLENVGQGIVTFHDDGVIESANNAVSGLFGYDARDLAGQSVTQLFSADPMADIGEILADAFVDQDAPGAALAITGHHRDGSQFPIEFTLSEFRLFGRSCMIMLVRDITRRRAWEEERAKLEGELRQMHKMESIGTMAGGISHEFNNMLVPMIGLTELVAEEFPDGSQEKQNLQAVLDAGQRAKQLVAQILQFSRADESEATTVDFRQAWHDLQPLLSTTVPSTITVREQICAAPAMVFADCTELQQVLLNIIGNASDAMANTRGDITLGIKVETKDQSFATRFQRLDAGDYVHVWIQDNGQGIAEADVARVFDPFFTTKPVGEGTGMGLAVVHSIVGKAGGAIDVKSAPGEGTRFDFFFPRAVAPAAVAAA